MTKPLILKCNKCGSTKVQRLRNWNQLHQTKSNVVVCKDCGYRGDVQESTFFTKKDEPLVYNDETLEAMTDSKERKNLIEIDSIDELTGKEEPDGR